jgi:hypothetical protein
VVFITVSGSKEVLNNIRVTEDVSNRRWFALNDLKLSNATELKAIVANVSLMGDNNMVQKLMCLRPFTPENGATELMVSADWPGFGGGLAVND